MKKIILILILIILVYGGWQFSLFLGKEEKVEILPTEEPTELSLAQNEFGLNIFLGIIEENENAFISPYSIHTAMLLAYIGAEGETKKEMGEVLVLLGMEEEEIKNQVLELKNYLENVSKETKVSIANAFFLKEDIPFLQSYKNDGENYFDAELSILPSTGKLINQWVKNKTEDKIEEIIDPGPIPVDVIAYLVNAIYFKGTWEEEFDKEKTTERTFYGKKDIGIEMMERVGEYYYGVSENLQTVTIEYKDGQYLFHAFMPINGNLAEFYENLDTEILRKAKATNRGKIVLRLPKFTLEQNLKLSDTFKKMGMTKAFDLVKADFSNMVEKNELRENVYIGEVYHSSFIEVDEEGTEAAAATAVEMRLKSAPIEEAIIEFNNPFFFIIEEKETENILFTGQLVNP